MMDVRAVSAGFIWIPEDALQQQIQEESSSPVVLHNNPPPPKALRVSPCPHLSTDTTQSTPLERPLMDLSLKATPSGMCSEIVATDIILQQEVFNKSTFDTRHHCL